MEMPVTFWMKLLNTFGTDLTLKYSYLMKTKLRPDDLISLAKIIIVGQWPKC